MAVEREVLRKYYGNIKDGLSTSSISGELYSKEVITYEQKQYIDSKPIEAEKTTYLLDKALLPNIDNFYKFLEVLENTDAASSAHRIAKLLRDSITEKQKKQSAKETGKPQPSDSDHSPSPKRQKVDSGTSQGGSDEVQPISRSSPRNQELGDVDESKLWSEDDLKNAMPKSELLPSDIEDEVLTQVTALLLTVNNNEYHAVCKYLESLGDPPSNIYFYHHQIPGHQPETAIYNIGRYGAFAVAVTKIKPGSTVSGGAIAAPRLAHSCFRNLGAIIAVGVAAGSDKTKMCDVLVSSQVVDYTKARVENGHFTSRGYILPASTYLNQLFSTPDGVWPTEDFWDTLKASKLAKPQIRSGVILSGPYLVDDDPFKRQLLADFAPEAIGIEMEGAYLFAATQQSTIRTIIVKAVCDFADGQKNKIFQPTSALLAANYVKHIFDNQQARKIIDPRKETIDQQ